MSAQAPPAPNVGSPFILSLITEQDYEMNVSATSTTHPVFPGLPADDTNDGNGTGSIPVLLQSNRTFNNFVDFATSNLISWIIQRPYIPTSTVEINWTWRMLRDGIEQRLVPPEFMERDAVGPVYPGFPLVLQPGRKQFTATPVITGRPSTAPTANWFLPKGTKLFDMILAAPPAGAG